jgi:hypothetical protein
MGFPSLEFFSLLPPSVLSRTFWTGLLIFTGFSMFFIATTHYAVQVEPETGAVVKAPPT